MAWQLNELASLHWRCWSGEWAVFDVGSGQTHQMDTFTATTLMMLEAGPLDLPALGAQVADELQLPNNAELSSVLINTLEQLVSVGLIESTTP